MTYLAGREGIRSIESWSIESFFFKPLLSHFRPSLSRSPHRLNSSALVRGYIYTL